jgi:tRNA (mo5U34)-methyltransferase
VGIDDVPNWPSKLSMGRLVVGDVGWGQYGRERDRAAPSLTASGGPARRLVRSADMDTDRWPDTAEAEATLRAASYWHYPTPLPWADVPIGKADHPATWHEQRRAHFFAPLLERLGGSLAGRRVLDLGCCQGFWSFEAARAGAAACLGLDSSPAFVAEARALRAFNGLGACAFRQAHLEDEPWWQEVEPVDVCLFLGLFYHLADPLLVLRRAAALTQDAMVVDTEIAGGDEPSLLIRPRDPQELSTVGSRLSTRIRVVPTVAALVALLEDCGFTRVEVMQPSATMPFQYRDWLRSTVIARR